MGNAMRWLSASAAAAIVAALAHAATLDGSAGALRAAWAPADAPRIASAQTTEALSGTLYGLVERPFMDVARAVADPAGWCAVLILDPNVHRCVVQPARVEVAFGDSDTPVDFSFEPPVREADYLQVRMTAARGPFATRDYAIALEAAPLDAGRTVVHLAFSHRYGLAARLAMLAYFNTIGRGKVGFTVIGRDAAGAPVYVGEMRGGIERNLTRYYFAILAYLDSLSTPSGEQPERRVQAWLALTQRYPRQLREEPGYFERKVRDVRRLQAGG